jgi:hypothetical protein
MFIQPDFEVFRSAVFLLGPARLGHNLHNCTHKKGASQYFFLDCTIFVGTISTCLRLKQKAPPPALTGKRGQSASGQAANQPQLNYRPVLGMLDLVAGDAEFPDTVN